MREAQRLLQKPGYDIVSVAGRDGVSAEELTRKILPLLPPSIQVRTADEQADADKKGVSEFVNFIQYALLGFGGIALFVGAFVIFNTLSITVAQRTRELATLRTLGATRPQVLRLVVVEAVFVGLVASLVGIAVGVGLAEGLTVLFSAAGLDLPRAETVFVARTPIVALLLGSIVTLVASLPPALRATRVSPIAAVREGASLPKSRVARFAFPISIALVALAVAMLGYGLFSGGATSSRIIGVVLGTLALFVGVAMVSTRLLVPLAAMLGWPAAKLAGIAGQSFANDYGFAVGGWFIVRTPTGEMLNLRVRGIYTPPRFDSLLGSVVVSHQTFDRWFVRPSDSLTLLASDAPKDELAASLAP